MKIKAIEKGVYIKYDKNIEVSIDIDEIDSPFKLISVFFEVITELELKDGISQLKNEIQKILKERGQSQQYTFILSFMKSFFKKNNIEISYETQNTQDKTIQNILNEVNIEEEGT